MNSYLESMNHSIPEQFDGMHDETVRILQAHPFDIIRASEHRLSLLRFSIRADVDDENKIGDQCRCDMSDLWTVISAIQPKLN